MTISSVRPLITYIHTYIHTHTQGMTISSVRPLILGRAGTSVTLGLRRESEDTVVYVRVMREPVRLGEVLVPGVRVEEPGGDSASTPQPSVQQPQRQSLDSSQMQRCVTTLSYACVH
jgi:hypothetical protein